jgi:hypothetical protein
MKNIWKWILGIVIVLVVIAAVGFIASGFFVSRTARVERFEAFRPSMTDDFPHDDWHHPSFEYDRFHSPRESFGHRMPMYGNRGFSGRGFVGYGFAPWPFLFFGGLLRLIFPLAVLAAVGYFSYRKGKKDGAAEVLAGEPEPAEALKKKSKNK